MVLVEGHLAILSNRLAHQDWCPNNAKVQCPRGERCRVNDDMRRSVVTESCEWLGVCGEFCLMSPSSMKQTNPSLEINNQNVLSSVSMLVQR